jgi:hypothetical protein
MDVIGKKVTSLGFDREKLTIEGVQSLRFKRRRETISGQDADEYEAYCSKIAIRAPETEIIFAPGSPEFKEIERGLALHSLPLHDMLVEHGAVAPDYAAAFSFPYVKIDDFLRLDDEWFESLVSGDEKQTYELGWQKFRLTEAFEKTPCDRGTYDTLKAAFVDGGHLRSMDFGEYYNWFVRSSVKVDADGAPTPEAADEAEQIVDVWLTGSLDAKQMKKWLCRNLSIHPVHQAGFEAIIDEKTVPQQHASSAPGCQ